MKTCFKCNEPKPLDAFYKHQGTKDGRLNKCKLCAKLDSMKTYEKNTQNPLWVVSERKRQREKERKRRLSGLIKPQKRKEYPRPRANNQLSSAIAGGKITRRPCAVCGSRGQGGAGRSAAIRDQEAVSNR